MLQGSIEDFTLDEVLGLVSTTAKTGELRVEGDRGEGRLWLVDGHLTKASCAAVGDDADPVDVVFELLRYQTGSFSFVTGTALPGDTRIDIDSVLEAALDRVGEWEGIAEIVPSLDHVVSPVAGLPADEVTLDRDDWATLIAIGERRRVAIVLERLGLDEIAGSRRLKDLVERSLVEVGEPEIAPVAVSPVVEPVVAAPAAQAAPSFTVDTGADPVTASASTESVAAETADDTAPTSPFGGPTPVEIPAALTGTPAPFGLPDATATDDTDTDTVDAVGHDEAPVSEEATPAADIDPPSPSEIAEFGSKLSEPFDPASLVVSDTEENSLLMRYLKSDS